MQVKATKRKRAVPQDDATEAGNQEEEVNDDHNIEEGSRPAKRFRSSFTDTLTVLVGDEKSTFFDAACQREWIEGREKVVKLPEVTPDTFELYAAWVYQGKIEHEALRKATIIIQQIQANVHHEVEEQDNDFWSTSTLDLMKLHVAADFLGDAELMNRVMDGITDIIAAEGCWLTRLKDIVPLVWGATVLGSGLRRMVLDYTVYLAKHQSMRNLLRLLQPELPSEFFADLALHSLDKSAFFDLSELEPLPTRRHRYYEG
ncbi:hypothetical protein LTR17_016639 [Elasticomyces elasticus]|nr:hypothetical protein LTR17_016639 [Elasticomyces elasticus]